MLSIDHRPSSGTRRGLTPPRPVDQVTWRLDSRPGRGHRVHRRRFGGRRRFDWRRGGQTNAGRPEPDRHQGPHHDQLAARAIEPGSSSSSESHPQSEPTAPATAIGIHRNEASTGRRHPGTGGGRPAPGLACPFASRPGAGPGLFRDDAAGRGDGASSARACPASAASSGRVRPPGRVWPRRGSGDRVAIPRGASRPGRKSGGPQWGRSGASPCIPFWRADPAHGRTLPGIATPGPSRPRSRPRGGEHPAPGVGIIAVTGRSPRGFDQRDSRVWPPSHPDC